MGLQAQSGPATWNRATISLGGEGDWRMDLQKSKARVMRALLDLIEEGSKVRDRIDQEYRNKRSDRTFDQDQDMLEWGNSYSGWYGTCITKLEDLFEPSIFVTTYTTSVMTRPV